MKILKQRMYHLVLYNISPIQQGIQAYHAGIEYASGFIMQKEFQRWASVDKTIIILNGGTSNNLQIDDYVGTMEQHSITLTQNKIEHAVFHEPDLNNAMTAMAFLVDEMVWDKETYPDPIIEGHAYVTEQVKYAHPEFYEALKNAYGEKTAFLRTWLSKFRLA